MKKTFAQRLTNWRDKHGRTNMQAAVIITLRVGFRVPRRTLENWIQGREPRAAVMRLVLREIGPARQKQVERLTRIGNRTEKSFY